MDCERSTNCLLLATQIRLPFLWALVISPKLKKQLKKLDPSIRKRIYQDMQCLTEDPLQGWAVDFPKARKLNLRYIKVAGDWRLIFRIHDKKVLAEFVDHRGNVYKELGRYLRCIQLED